MARFGCADEIIVGTAERLDHRLKSRCILVGQLRWRHSRLTGRLVHFQAVLIGAGQETNIIAIQALEAGERIGGQRFIGVADMRRAVGIGNGGRDVIAIGHRVVEGFLEGIRHAGIYPWL
jgi:hypothetical protein